MSGFLRFRRHGRECVIEHHVEGDVFTLYASRSTRCALRWAFAHADLYGIPFPGGDVVPLFAEGHA